MFKEFRNIYIASLVLFFIFLTGVIGFIHIENFSFIEAVFMTIITMSTVGYEEVNQLSETGMIFTVVLIVFSLGLFGYLVTSITRIFFDGEYKKYLKEHYLNKKLNRMKDHVVVCGFGRNGRQSVIQLLGNKENVIFIEKSDSVVKEDINEEIMKNKKLTYIHGDASHETTLEKVHLQTAKALITTLPNDAENLLIVLTVKDINKDLKIISRASDEHSYAKLKRAGADNVIMPDIVGGTRMAKLVTEPNIIEFLEMIMLQDGVDVNLEEISCSDLASCFVEKTILNLDIRKKTGASIIGLKLGSGKYVFNPNSDIKLQKEDKLFVLGTPGQVATLKDALDKGIFFQN